MHKLRRDQEGAGNTFDLQYSGGGRGSRCILHDSGILFPGKRPGKQTALHMDIPGDGRHHCTVLPAPV